MRKRHKMVGWFDPILMVQTGIRVAISSIFGEFVDRREAMATANAIEPQPFDRSFDYSGHGEGNEFLLDYLADTGDGWDSTFAMARLVTARSLRPDGIDQELPRGQVIVLGGDEVYPVASAQAYRERFLAPFDEAFANLSDEDGKGMPDLYAMPGNHDWYDGLKSFLALFARRTIAAPGTIRLDRPGRIVAGRATRQTRSYFALKLPGGWWLWATDSQLAGYIDQPQIDYFRFAAKNWMEPAANVILCVGVPSWTHIDCGNPIEQFRTLSYLERLPSIARNEDGELMGHRLRLVLAGDSHHYSRYQSCGVDYITCGGGGAFLHPTDHLKDKSFEWAYPPPGVAVDEGADPYRRDFKIAEKKPHGGKAVFPDEATSKALGWRNLAFAWLNPKFTFVLACAYLVFNWLVHSISEATGTGTLADALAPDFLRAVTKYTSLIFASPAPMLLLGGGFCVCYYLADTRSASRRLATGALHTVAHILLAGSTAILAIRATSAWWSCPLPFSVGPVLSLAVAAIISATASATLLGVYFIINLRFWGLHWNEAFSALRIADYKCFLRLRINLQGDMVVYPIGLTKVPKGRQGGALPQCHLIEEPILIKARD